MADGNPNIYTRANVLALARVIDPGAWSTIPVGKEPRVEMYPFVEHSITIAARVLKAGYRDCTVK